MDNNWQPISNLLQTEKLPNGLKLLDTAVEIAKWNNEAHTIGLKVLEEREKEEKATLKRPRHSLYFAPVPAAKAVVAENVAKLNLLV